MQAKKDQDWTDNADFWDEAWADMNARLDAEPNRRKGFLAWWPFYTGVVVVLSLAILLGSGVFSKKEPTTTVPPATSVIAETDSADSKSKTNDVFSLVAGEETTRLSSSDLNQAAPLPQSTNKELAAAPSPNTTKRKAKVVSPVNATPSQRIAPPMDAEEHPAISSSDQTASTNTVPAPKMESAIPRSTREDRITKAASLQLTPLAITPLPSGLEYPLPELPVQQQRYRNPLTFDGAYTSSFNLQQPGYLLGIGYRLKNGSRFSFPLSLRYRLGKSKIKELNLVEVDQAGAPTTGNDENNLTPVSISTDALELGAGLAWSATPRLRFSTGFSAAYQLRALVSFESNNPTSFGDQPENGFREIYSVNFSRSQNLISDLNQGETSPEFKRWVLRANAGVAYDIKPRLSVNLKATHLLRQPDRAQVIGLQTGRMELGLSYRLR